MKRDGFFVGRIFRASFQLWQRHFWALCAIYSLNYFSGIGLSNALDLINNEESGWVIFPVVLAVLILATAQATVALLMMAFFLQQSGEKGRAAWGRVWTETVRRFVSTLYANVTIVGLLFGMVLVGAGCYTIAIQFSETAAESVRLALGVVTGTVFVVSLLAGLWYFFFFSLTPYIVAFEGLPVGPALLQSRQRIRSCAWRYLSVFVLFLVGYLGVGLMISNIIFQLAQSPDIFRSLVSMGIVVIVPSGKMRVLVDPLLGLVFTPLAVTLWYFCYHQLQPKK